MTIYEGITVFCQVSSLCSTCYWPWDQPTLERDACQTNSTRAFGVATLIVCTTMALFVVFSLFELHHEGGLTGRRIRVEDISMEGDATTLIMTSLGQHHLRAGGLAEHHIEDSLGP